MKLTSGYFPCLDIYVYIEDLVMDIQTLNIDTYR